MNFLFRTCLGLITGLLIMSGSVHASKKNTSYAVNIESMKFSPQEIHVRKGDSIVWKNNDLVPHTVTAANQSFDSKTIDPGKTWKLVIKNKADIDYICTFHPMMTAKITMK